ncbi:hypothetical protein [Actinoplanes hulinensis]|uniref:hypothetical protein n=1 Tax=Actinoplanes hulinensis TaxID=1144547 RepID=UPI001C667379|nr:hypothetical protein [Actinoplanes hulinensis]
MAEPDRVGVGRDGAVTSKRGEAVVAGWVLLPGEQLELRHTSILPRRARGSVSPAAKMIVPNSPAPLCAWFLDVNFARRHNPAIKVLDDADRSIHVRL